MLKIRLDRATFEGTEEWAARKKCLVAGICKFVRYGTHYV